MIKNSIYMQGMWHYMNGSKEGTEMINALINYSTVCSVFDKGYRYGFNTHEEDIEIFNGAYSAEYWEYDSRLGRRWNLDPVVKFYLSSYSVLHNSPIIYIDINGDDDFFDSEGNYIGSTPSGNFIRVVNSGVNFENAKSNVDLNTKLITSFDYSKTKIGKENRNMLKKVLGHYCLPLGITKYGSGYKSASNSTAAYYDPSDGYVTLNIDKKTRKINPILDDINNLKSVLVHEKKHRDDKSTSESLYHYKAIIASFEDPSYINTTELYKTSQLNYALALFGEAAKEKQNSKYKYSNNQLIKEINIFNKALKASGSTCELTYDSKTRTVTILDTIPVVILKFTFKAKKDSKDSIKSTSKDTLNKVK